MHFNNFDEEVKRALLDPVKSKRIFRISKDDLLSGNLEKKKRKVKVFN